MTHRSSRDGIVFEIRVGTGARGEMSSAEEFAISVGGDAAAKLVPPDVEAVFGPAAVEHLWVNNAVDVELRKSCDLAGDVYPLFSPDGLVDSLDAIAMINATCGLGATTPCMARSSDTRWPDDDTFFSALSQARNTF